MQNIRCATPDAGQVAAVILHIPVGSFFCRETGQAMEWGCISIY
jgi:hypothetical protein